MPNYKGRFNATVVNGVPDIIYSADDYNAFFGIQFENGVRRGYGSEFSISKSGTNIVVRSGAMLFGMQDIKMHLIKQFSTNVPLSANTYTNNRKDVIIGRWDVGKKSCDIFVKEGSDVDYPAIIKTTSVYEYELYRFETLPNGTITNIQPQYTYLNDYFDRRGGTLAGDLNLSTNKLISNGRTITTDANGIYLDGKKLSLEPSTIATEADIVTFGTATAVYKGYSIKFNKFVKSFKGTIEAQVNASADVKIGCSILTDSDNTTGTHYNKSGFGVTAGFGANVIETTIPTTTMFIDFEFKIAKNGQHVLKFQCNAIDGSPSSTEAENTSTFGHIVTGAGQVTATDINNIIVIFTCATGGNLSVAFDKAEIKEVI